MRVGHALRAWGAPSGGPHCGDQGISGMSRLAPAPTIPALDSRIRPRWWLEVILLGAMYLMYDGVRLLVSAGHGEAFANAHRVRGLDHALRLSHERSINQAVSASTAIGVTLYYAYATLHYVVTPVVLVWLWHA